MLSYVILCYLVLCSCRSTLSILSGEILAGKHQTFNNQYRYLLSCKLSSQALSAAILFISRIFLSAPLYRFREKGSVQYLGTVREYSTGANKPN